MQRSDLGCGVVTVRDAHHEGFFEWAFDGHNLWHKATINSKWTRVKKVGFTPARMLLLAELIERWTIQQLEATLPADGEARKIFDQARQIGQAITKA